MFRNVTKKSETFFGTYGTHTEHRKKEKIKYNSTSGPLSAKLPNPSHDKI